MASSNCTVGSSSHEKDLNGKENPSTVLPKK